MTPELAGRIREQSIQTLYRQIPNSFAAAAVVTVYMIATAAPYTPWPTILAWAVVQLLSQFYRAWIYWRFRRAAGAGQGVEGQNTEVLARRVSGYMLLAGLIWGASIFLFAHPDNPITVALTLCGLYGISGGSVPGNAYNPVGLYLFIWAIFVAVMLRMLMLGGFGLIVLGIASLGFAGILTLFCRVQHRTLVEGFLIRFENESLLAEVIAQKAHADTARDAAEAANLAKSQFLAAASHDLRQPLYALGLLSGALQAQQLEPEAEQIVGRIQTSVGALASLFEGLLDISRLDAGVITPSIVPVRIQALFDRLTEYFASSAEGQGLRLRLRPSSLWVDADPVLLESILANLIANAVRYTRAGGVLVAARPDRGQDRHRGRVTFEVWDTGVGIDPADRKRIFSEFVQVGNPERDREKGFGLGLAIAQRTAALLGSSIRLSSRPGRGSVFRVDAPVVAAPADAAGAETPDAIDLVHGLRVLILDDEASVRDGFCLLLRRWGAEVSSAASLEEAVAFIASGAVVDVALCDYRIGGDVNGFDAIEALVAGQAAPPAVCLVTGDLDPQLLSLAQQRGVHLAHKPLRPAKLRALLNHLAAVREAEPL